MTESGFKRRIYLTEEQREELFARLNSSSDAAQRRRSSTRHDYHMLDIPVCIMHPDGGESRVLVCGRNISSGGLSVLHGGYVHIGSRCRVVLRRVDNKAEVITGIVRHCRLVAGSCHEIGIQFLEDVDPAEIAGCTASEEDESDEHLVNRRAVHGNIIITDTFRPDRMLLKHQLQSYGLTVASASTPGQVLDTVQRLPIDVVLTGLTVIDEEALHLIRRLREVKFNGPVLLLTADTSPTHIYQAYKAGATGALPKPYSIDLLMAELEVHLGEHEFGERLFSTVEQQEELRPLVSEYVSLAHRRADQIQRSYESGDHDMLRELCLTFKGSGCVYGFHQLTVAAIRTLEALNGESHNDAVLADRVDRLIRCCRALTTREVSNVA